MKPSEALLKHGSDKVTTHAYGGTYDRIFQPAPSRIETPVRLLEIGVQTGVSLKAWESAGVGAVYGFDVNPLPDDFDGAARFARLDATDPAAVRQALAAWHLPPASLNVIIDDGSHTFREQFAAFGLLWDYVAPGGWYVIEDVQPDTPTAPFVRLGGVVYDLRHVKGRYDDVMILFRKPL